MSKAKLLTWADYDVYKTIGEQAQAWVDKVGYELAYAACARFKSDTKAAMSKVPERKSPGRFDTLEQADAWYAQPDVAERSRLSAQLRDIEDVRRAISDIGELQRSQEVEREAAEAEQAEQQRAAPQRERKTPEAWQHRNASVQQQRAPDTQTLGAIVTAINCHTILLKQLRRKNLTNEVALRAHMHVAATLNERLHSLDNKGNADAGHALFKKAMDAVLRQKAKAASK